MLGCDDVEVDESISYKLGSRGFFTSTIEPLESPINNQHEVE